MTSENENLIGDDTNNQELENTELYESKIKQQEINKFKTCPNCGKKCNVESAFCRNCGTRIEFKCQNCGADCKEDDSFCIKCGVKLDSPRAFSEKTEQSPKMVQSPQQPYFHNNLDNLHNRALCPYCGSNIGTNIQKCPHCGEWLSEVSHFGCGAIMMIIATVLGICFAIFFENIIGSDGSFLTPWGGSIALWSLVVAFLYFLPSLIAELRGHDSKFEIFIVNLLTGWTGIIWVVALVIAFTGKRR